MFRITINDGDFCMNNDGIGRRDFMLGDGVVGFYPKDFFRSWMS